MTLRANVEVHLGSFRLAVDVTVHRGEVVAVLGPNGAGKTTLLRSLAGLVPIDAGSVEVDGEVWESAGGVRLAPHRRGAGVVFQERLLFPHLSARKNVAFGLRSRGLRRGQASAAAERWLERVGLADRADARPAELSGGQAQRVALARALAGEPSLLLLDEPMAALDVAARQALRRDLRSYLGQFAGPCVLVTHEPLEAITLADRLVIIEDGRVVQDGVAAEVARRPRSAWVARLVGLNLYTGYAEGAAVTVEEGGVLHTASSAHGPVFAVVHPRAVAVHRDEPRGSPRNTWPALVEGMDLHGDSVRLHLQGPMPVVAEITPAALAELAIAEGQRVWVAVKATEVELFDR